ncbi:helix-turn-helix transcriptional regulator [Colidextribacter sp. OB.20]|uniref:helix-turn-helix domain-containing protein n=1 Tax=Colidextribacter sp. OB.20 TaxID=2304568 RepID=UPI00191C64D0|nr:helix-turn-helix transcriptional regulator [Colidextribacter sp. OB.20]
MKDKLKLEVFAVRLRELRQEKHMTQRQMGDLMGITERNYQRWEKGEVNASGTALIFLGDFFGVSADYLLGRTENREINR